MKGNIIFLELQAKGVKCCLVSTWVKPTGQNVNSLFFCMLEFFNERLGKYLSPNHSPHSIHTGMSQFLISVF